MAEHLNFSEASHRIHVAQPAISQTILDLEEELGVRLLLRDRRTVQLTAPGETFRREALEILSRHQEAVRLTKRASLGEVGYFSPHVVNEPDRISTVLLLVESGIGVSIVAGSVRHLVRAGGTVLFCRLQPVSAPIELRLNWRRVAPSSPTVEAL